MLFLGGKSFEDMSWEEVADTIDAPGRIRRVDIRSFPPSGYIASKDGHHDQMTISPQIQGEEGYEPRPKILQGLDAGAVIRRSEFEQMNAKDFAELEAAMDRAVQRMHPMLEQERDRRIKAEVVADELRAEMAKMRDELRSLDYDYAKAMDAAKEVTQLRKENKEMKKWGAELKKRMEEINTLSWMKDVARNVPKD